jgi:hypothetical protein
MNEIDFYSYSLFVQDARGYHKNWKYAIFKAKYGRWIKTKEREGVTPKEPTQEYLGWLDNFLSTWSKLAVSIGRRSIIELLYRYTRWYLTN